MRRRRAAMTVLPFLLALTACEPFALASGTAGEPGRTAGSGPTIDSLPTLGPPPSATPPGDSAPVVLDAELLLVLPETVDGVPIMESLDEAALALTDPALPRIATALDVGVAVDTGSADLVAAHVVRLRPGAFTDDTYRQWRDSFDDGACAAADGVSGHAEATIDARTVYITSCVGEAEQRTYHVWLTEPDILISASSIGDRRFGERLMDNLRVPH